MSHEEQQAAAPALLLFLAAYRTLLTRLSALPRRTSGCKRLNRGYPVTLPSAQEVCTLLKLCGGPRCAGDRSSWAKRQQPSVDCGITAIGPGKPQLRGKWGAPPPALPLLPQHSARPCTQPAGSVGRLGTMAPRNVRDVPAEEFIKAYAAHLKSNDKVPALRWAVHQAAASQHWDSGGGCPSTCVAAESAISLQPPACWQSRCKRCNRNTVGMDGRSLGCVRGLCS